MLHVVGGAYRETCIEPHWNQFFGSGVKAASAVTKRASEITLHTYIDKNNQALLKSMGATFGFEIETQPRANDIEFSYDHALSRPEIYPYDNFLKQEDAFEVSGENILCFGCIEAEPVITADKVVYDPQSSYNPRPFRQNGSSARTLAIVANLREAFHLTGEGTVLKAGRLLKKNHGADVVVIKRGAWGAYVFTENEETAIPAFRTQTVWPIGSGDIFSATFAYAWMIDGMPPVQAARLASMSTAYHCQTKTLPIPQDVEQTNEFESGGVPDFSLDNVPQVYLAGPFFNIAQRWLIFQAKKALEDLGVKVFSPFHDVGLGTAEEVVEADIEGLQHCNVVLALVDGMDSGTIFEVGYARSRDIPVVVLSESENEEALKMLEGTKCDICNDFVTSIYKTVWAGIDA